jgi:DNA-binding FadR family transcriptional regulator
MIGNFTPVKSRRLSDAIGEQIRERLAASELGPGDRLPSERELAIQLNVSRNAVREALRMLETSGVLTLHKGAKGGAFISNGDATFLITGLQDLLNLGGITIEQITEARVWLGEIVTRVACERATEEDFKLLEDNIAEAEQALVMGDLDRKLQLQIEFHNILARTTRNPMLSVIMASITQLMLNFASTMGAEDNDLAIQSRRRFMPLLKARDSEAAIAEMSEHLNTLKARYVRLMTESGKPAPDVADRPKARTRKSQQSAGS